MLSRMLMIISLTLVSVCLVGFGGNLFIKNFQELPLSLEAATNVSRLHPEIADYFDIAIPSLPKRGIVDELDANAILVNASYASYFCSRMISSDARKSPNERWVHSQVDFSKRPSQISDENLLVTLNEYGQLFYQRALTEQEEEIFISLYSGLTVDFNDRPQDQTQIWLGVCVAFSTSFDFLRKM